MLYRLSNNKLIKYKLINIFLFSFLSSVYLLCSGLIFFKKDIKENNDIFLHIFFGAISISFIALIANFFISLNQTFNTIILILILIFGSIIILKKQIIYKSIIACSLIALVSTLILTFDTIYRPDASMYHLPYTKIINDNKIIFGISNVHFRFGHTSILQYLNAFFNNHLFGVKGIITPAAIIFSSLVLYFYYEINKNLDKDKIYSYFIFLILAYILYGYNRYSEFGNDTIAHLYFLLISSLLLKKNFKEKFNFDILINISLLSIFCFMLKSSLILILTIPLTLLLINFKKEYLVNLKSLLLIFITLLWFTKNLITSGCLIYPIEFTCFEQLDWFTNNTEYLSSAKLQALDNQAWSKGWSNYIGAEITQVSFVKNFFWVKTWLSVHGIFIFKKLSIYLLILIILHQLVKRINPKEYLFKIKINNEILFLFFLSLIGVSLWFLRFPIFRYGSSYLVLLITIFTLIFAIKNQLADKDTKKLKKLISISIITFFTLFVLKHVNRIYKNFDSEFVNNPWPKFHTEEQRNLTFSSDKIIKNGITNYFLLTSNYGCGYSASPCTPYKINKIYFSIKKVINFTM